jgi:hypothetical protein
MKSKRPITRISPEKMKQMKGFEEVLEGMSDEEIKKIAKRGGQEQKEDTNDLSTFLTIEEERLKKLDQFFKQKIQNITNPELVASLIKTQQKELDRTKATLIEEVIPLDSIPNMYLSKIFNSAFSIKARG